MAEGNGRWLSFEKMGEGERGLRRWGGFGSREDGESRRRMKGVVEFGENERNGVGVVSSQERIAV